MAGGASGAVAAFGDGGNLRADVAEARLHQTMRELTIALL